MVRWPCENRRWPFVLGGGGYSLRRTMFESLRWQSRAMGQGEKVSVELAAYFDATTGSFPRSPANPGRCLGVIHYRERSRLPFRAPMIAILKAVRYGVAMVL